MTVPDPIEAEVDAAQDTAIYWRWMYGTEANPRKRAVMGRVLADCDARLLAARAARRDRDWPTDLPSTSTERSAA